MANSLDFTQEKGLYEAVQRGVLFPDGSTIWGDPAHQNRVRIPFLTERDEFFLDRVSLNNSGPDVLYRTYNNYLQATHGDPASRLVIVERTLTLVISNAETDTERTAS